MCIWCCKKKNCVIVLSTLHKYCVSCSSNYLKLLIDSNSRHTNSLLYGSYCGNIWKFSFKKLYLCDFLLVFTDMFPDILKFLMWSSLCAYFLIFPDIIEFLMCILPDISGCYWVLYVHISWYYWVPYVHIAWYFLILLSSLCPYFLIFPDILEFLMCILPDISC